MASRVPTIDEIKSMSFNEPGLHAVPAAEAAVSERALFLQRTYTWLLGGILGFCGVLMAWDNAPVLQDLTRGLYGNFIIPLVVLIGMAWFAHAVAEKHPLNIVAYALYVLVFGLLIAPLVYMAKDVHITQAAVVTGVTFIGLTAYVFKSGKDFSFLGGALAVGLFGLIAVAIAGWIFGFSVGLGFSVVAAILFAGYILYDTSRILHHYPTTAHVSAAIVLFVDVVLLFKHLLILFMSRDD